MTEKKTTKLNGNELRYFCIFSAILIFAIAFVMDSPKDVLLGTYKIFASRGVLITDYIELAGYGAAFFNAGLMFVLGMVLIELEKSPYTGLSLAALFICAGFALWGKNLVNTLPIVFGTWLYCKVEGCKFEKFMYTTLFATCLGPFVSEMPFILPIPLWGGLICALLIGIFIGFVIPPLSLHIATFHKGYNLFNVGFCSGLLGFFMYSIFKCFGLSNETAMIWKEGRPMPMVIGLFVYFLLTFLLGLWMEGGNIKVLFTMTKHSGRSKTDFVLLEGAGATLMNMGALGIVAEVYIWLIGGDFSGPIVGCILTVYGFAAFGAHLRNYPPLLLGVFLSTFFSVYTPLTPGIMIAALFIVGIAPIGGQFGVIVGILTGMIHAAVVMCTGPLYGGLNLYNNGFAEGMSLVIIVPLLENFIRLYEEKKQKKQCE